MYYQRAKELLDQSTGSFQSVQAYLLMGQYFQSTNEAHECWMMIGAAARTAQSLGLHLPEATQAITSVRRRELYRKVWHGCVLMDRVVSMTYGRPPMINAALAAGVPRPFAMDEQYLPREAGAQIPQLSKPSMLDFHLQTLELYEILYDVLVDFYTSSSGEDLSVEEACRKYLGRSGAGNTFSILDIESRLVHWEKRLPSHLRLDTSNQDIERTEYSMRQTFILRQRYLHIRLLSLRPILSAYVASETSNMESAAASSGGLLFQRIALQCAITCVTIAQETIDLAYTKRPSDPSSVGPIAAWWYNVLFVYTAATVIVAAKLCPSILSEVPEESITQYWNLAIEILQYYQVFNPVIEQHIIALQLLFSVLPRHYLQYRPTRSPEASHILDSSADHPLRETSILETPARQCGGSQGVVLSQPEDPPRMGDVAVSDQVLQDPDFEFVFDNNDVSWFNPKFY